MLQIRIGIHLTSLRLPLAKAAPLAKKLGADAVEIDARGELNPQALSRTGLRQVRKLLDDLQLRVAAVTFRTRRGYNVKDELDRRVEATRQAMKFAFELGASVVVNQVGRIPAQSEGESWTLLTEVLADLGRYGQRIGATLAAETGSEEGADLARLLAALPAGALGVTFSPGNLIVNGFSASEAINALAKHVLLVHATDAVRDLGRGRGSDVPLGRGSADYPHILSVLEEQQFQGYLSIERDAVPQPQLEIAQAIEYLRQM
ncbi:MAG: sugar phosphate isomerase/epimerase family protein [Pirellulales bacterium]